VLRVLDLREASRETFDVAVATYWTTALELARMRATRAAYFVQSIESRFYQPIDPRRRTSALTYDLPVAYVTEARWIADYLEESSGHRPAVIRNGVRKDLFSPVGHAVAPRDPARTRVLVEGPLNVDFKNTGLAVNLARKGGADEIWLLTSSSVSSLPWVSRVFSRVHATQTPAIYRSCDFLVKLSTVEGMFGPPLEQFHCGGTAVTFDVAGFDEYVVPGYNALVLRSGDLRGTVAAIRDLLNDRELLRLLQAGALDTAATWPSWDQSSAQFAEWLESLDMNVPTDRRELAVAIQRIKDVEAQTSPLTFSGRRRENLVAMAPDSIRRSARRVRDSLHVIAPRYVGPTT
jgi:hypothetical protein